MCGVCVCMCVVSHSSAHHEVVLTVCVLSISACWIQQWSPILSTETVRRSTLQYLPQKQPFVCLSCWGLKPGKHSAGNSCSQLQHDFIGFLWHLFSCVHACTSMPCNGSILSSGRFLHSYSACPFRPRSHSLSLLLSKSSAP